MLIELAESVLIAVRRLDDLTLGVSCHRIQHLPASVGQNFILVQPQRACDPFTKIGFRLVAGLCLIIEEGSAHRTDLDSDDLFTSARSHLLHFSLLFTPPPKAVMLPVH